MDHGLEKTEKLDKSLEPKTEYRSSELLIKDDDNTSMRRVNVEIISFDWIFEGNNATNMIAILANNATTQLLV